MSGENDIFEWEERDPSTPFLVHAVAGSCAGVAEHVSMYPLDTVKTKMQTSPVSLNTRQAFESLLQERGVRGLMRGSMAIGFGCVPAHVSFFGTYEYAKLKLVDRNAGEELQTLQIAKCGAVAAVSHDLILTPHDVVKQRLQLGHYHGVRHCVQSMIRNEGPGVFFRSLPVTMAMNIPYTGILVATNDTLKQVVGSSSGRLSDAPMHFLLAGISGSVAATATLPFDVVKTAVQTQGLNTVAASAVHSQTPPRMPGIGAVLTAAFAQQQNLFVRAFSSVSAASATFGCQGADLSKHQRPRPGTRGVYQTVCSIIQQQGVGGLFRGIGPRVALAAPSAAISWGTYETVRNALSSH